MSIPLSELNQLTGSCNPDECVRNLRRIVQDPFPDVDRVSVVRDESFDPRQSSVSQLSELLRHDASNGSERVDRKSGALPEIDEPAWGEYLENMARDRDRTLHAYDVQLLLPCTVRGQCIGWLLLWRRIGAAPISKRTRETIDERMPFASYLMMDLVKTVTPRTEGTLMLEAAVERMVGVGKLGRKEREVIVRLMRGHHYAEISQQMRISENTVAKHVKSAYRKLDVHSALEAVNKYLIDALMQEANGGKGLDRYIIMYP